MKTYGSVGEALRQARGEQAEDAILFIAGSLYLAGEILAEEKQMINFDEEIRNYRSSLEISAVEDAIVRSDLTDMKDILMELLKRSGETEA